MKEDLTVKKKAKIKLNRFITNFYNYCGIGGREVFLIIDIEREINNIPQNFSKYLNNKIFLNKNSY